MGLDERLGNRQSEAGASAIGATVEQLEDQLALVGRDPWARIGDRDLDLVLRSSAARRLHEDLGIGRAVPGGVLQQVRQRLGDECGVHLERGKVCCHDPAQSRRVERALDECSGFVDKVVGCERLALRLERARLEPPKVEHGGDKARQSVGLFLDGLEQVPACGFGEDDGRFSKIGHGDLDRGERRAQVVRNGADQCRTPLVDFLEEVCPQRLVAELGTFDRKSSVVGIGREQPPVVDVERPATQDEEPDRAARGRQRYLS